MTIILMGFSRQEYWTVLPFPSPGDLPNLGIKPRSLALQADSLPTEPQGKPSQKGVISLKRIFQLIKKIFGIKETIPMCFRL